MDVADAEARGPRVRGAGGIVVRDGRAGREVLLVHRPRGDWTFPKGKAEPAERDEDAALREVEEETGLWCTLGARAGETHYVDAAGRLKVVRYWLMTPAGVGHEFVANDEVDELRWCTRHEAAALLSYPPDRRLLAALPEDVV